MSKLLVLNGSPRKKGNSSILSEYLISNLSNDYQSEQLFLYDYPINPCIAGLVRLMNWNVFWMME